MSSADDYRTNAQDCLRMVRNAAEERDRPLWATMAQSWLRLAEHAERVALVPEAPADETARANRLALAPAGLPAAEGADEASEEPSAAA